MREGAAVELARVGQSPGTKAPGGPGEVFGGAGSGRWASSSPGAGR
jgi:hypothetical protein